MRISDSIVNIRDGEESKLWFRSDRLFKIVDKWFFSTRDDQDVGPFNSRVEAARALGAFIFCTLNYGKSAGYAISHSLKDEWGTAIVH